MTDDYFDIENERDPLSDEDDDDFKQNEGEANNLMYLDQLEIGDD